MDKDKFTDFMDELIKGTALALIIAVMGLAAVLIY